VDKRRVLFAPRQGGHFAEILTMNIKASGRAAVIIAAGLWVCISGPVQAAEDADGAVVASRTEAAPGAPVALNKFTKSRHRIHATSHRTAVKPASKAPAGRSKKPEAMISDNKSNLEPDLKDGALASSLPSFLANAHAQLADADPSPGSATALSSQARDRLQLMAANQPAPESAALESAADAAIVAADQLNDVDRVLSEAKTEEKAPAATLPMAVAQAPAAVASSDDSAWGQTSLIGKIFIAFGGLLTLASAARMFMA
jgi:hypothetical protein